MTYELAEELKKAGYELPLWDQRFNGTYEGVICIDGGEYREPTLSELVDACGKELKALVQEGDRWKAQGWVRAFFGDTHKEAVTKLWLALNKK